MAFTYNIIVIVLLILYILGVSNMLDILPSLMRSITFWREHMHIESKMSVTRPRNYYDWLCWPTLAIIALRYDILTPGFIHNMAPWLQPFVMIGFVGIYILLRNFAYFLTFGRVDQRSVAYAAHHCIANYSIVATLLVLIVVGLFSFFKVPETAIQVAYLVILGIFYLLALVGKSQIMNSKYSPFMTFLYLCTLEFLPTGLLIAAAMLL